MTGHTYRGRRAAVIENEHLRVTVLEGGGHVAEILDKRTNVNPLWTPAWPSIEPAAYDPAVHREYGDGGESRLLAGIMGHNICLDIFGPPSADEAAAGLTAHGDGPVIRYDIAGSDRSLVMRAHLPAAQLRFVRTIELHDRAVRFHEIIDSDSPFDRPIGWTQHVTLGPPFLEKGATEFRIRAAKSQAYGGRFGDDDYLQPGGVFDWPAAPRATGGSVDLRRFSNAVRSSAYTTHLMDARDTTAYFVAFTPAAQLAFGYVWQSADFPWLGIWEENLSRTAPPWNGTTIACGMEFGVSPFPETRRQMVDRGRTFDTPGFRWLPARARLTAEFWAVVQPATAVPESLGWPVRRA